MDDLPVSSMELIDWLDKTTEKVWVTAETLKDPVKLAEQAGKRGIVDMLVNLKEAHIAAKVRSYV